MKDKPDIGSREAIRAAELNRAIDLSFHASPAPEASIGALRAFRRELFAREPSYYFETRRLPPRDLNGELLHPDWNLIVTTGLNYVDYQPFFEAAGLEVSVQTQEAPEDWEEDRDDDWVEDFWWFWPVPPSLDKNNEWRLVSICDDEVGGCIAIWARPKAK